MPKVNTTENFLGTKEDIEQNNKIEVLDNNVDNSTDFQLNTIKQNIINDNGSLNQFLNKNNQTNSVEKVSSLKQEVRDGGLLDVNDLIENTTKITELQSNNDTLPEETTVKDAKR